MTHLTDDNSYRRLRQIFSCYRKQARTHPNDPVLVSEIRLYRSTLRTAQGQNTQMFQEFSSYRLRVDFCPGNFMTNYPGDLVTLWRKGREYLSQGADSFDITRPNRTTIRRTSKRMPLPGSVGPTPAQL